MLNYKENFKIKNLTTFKIGGEIKRVYFPKNVEEFETVLNKHPQIKVFGNLSNTLISSDGYDSEIVLTTEMDNISITNNIVIADAGVKGPKLSQTVAENGLSGLEFMIGFPGSVGGEVYMNASANSQSISDNLVSVICYSPQKGLLCLTKDDMKFDYRHSICQEENLIVLQAKFELSVKEKSVIKQQMDDNLKFRREHQPSLALPNCGSIFKNPKDNSAGKLLDSVGAKNMKFGNAKVWENHANFIVNENDANSLDILELMNKMKTTVKETYNIELTPEIIFLGGKNERENELCKSLYKVK